MPPACGIRPHILWALQWGRKGFLPRAPTDPFRAGSGTRPPERESSHIGRVVSRGRGGRAHGGGRRPRGCASHGPTRCTSPRWAPRSSTSCRTTSRSASTSSTPRAAAPPCCSGSPTVPAASPSSKSGCPNGAPDWLQTTVVSTPNGTTSNALVVADIAHVVWAVNLGCLGLHLWPYRAADPEHADELRIDLDPTPGVGFDEVRGGCASAAATCSTSSGLRGYPKTTGNRGLHIYLRLEPRWDSTEVRAAAVALARELERRHPDLITANWWKEERGERVFVDFNQNAPHKTVFGAWFARPRTGGQVSTPLVVGRGRDVVPDDLTIRTVPDLLRGGATPGPTSPRSPSRSSRCSSWPSGTRRPGCTTRRGRPSTPRCPTSRPASPPAGPRRPRRWTPGRRPAADRVPPGARTAPTPTRSGPSATRRRRWTRMSGGRAGGAGGGRAPPEHRRRRQVDRPGDRAGARGSRSPTTWPSSRVRASPATFGSTGRHESCWSQLRGDCHSHSDWSDGGSPIREMAEAARALGREYLVLTDHSARLTVAHGLERRAPSPAARAWSAELNEELAPFRILTGIEVDILEDGALDQDATSWPSSTSWWPASTPSSGWTRPR